MNYASIPHRYSTTKHFASDRADTFKIVSIPHRYSTTEKYDE